MEFNYSKLIFSCELQFNVTDRYHFFAIRRQFAEIFRRTVGCNGRGSDKCSNPLDCPYEQVFSQEMSSNPHAIKRFQKPPLPFAFNPPLLSWPPNTGDKLEIGLSLAGCAVNHLTHFIDAVKSMLELGLAGMPGVANLVKIESIDYLGNRTVIAEDRNCCAFQRSISSRQPGTSGSRPGSSPEKFRNGFKTHCSDGRWPPKQRNQRRPVLAERHYSGEANFESPSWESITMPVPCFLDLPLHRNW